MTMLTRNQLLLAKVETTEGVDALPTAASNAVLTEPVGATPDVQKIASSVVRASISAAKERLGRKKVSFSITAEVRGSGTAGTAPDFSPLLQACALKETVDNTLGSEKVEYRPVSSSAEQKSVTIYFHYDGKLIKATGCRGNARISMQPGEIAKIEFELQGSLSGESDAALPSDAVHNLTEPPVAEEGGVKLGTFEGAVVKSLGLATGNELADRLDINSPGGLKSVMVVSRDPSLELEVEATPESVHAWWGNYTGRVEETVSAQIGTVAGNRFKLEVPAACLKDGAGSPRDSGGIVTYSLGWQALEDTGDDNYKLIFD